MFRAIVSSSLTGPTISAAYSERITACNYTLPVKKQADWYRLLVPFSAIADTSDDLGVGFFYLSHLDNNTSFQKEILTIYLFIALFPLT